MRKIAILLAAVALVAGSAQAKSQKRGICINSISEKILAPSLDGVGWFYNWGTACSLSGYEGMEFVPMVWNALDDSKEKGIRNWVKNNPGCKYLLGFNEPNFPDQANMTPAAAAANWPRVQALAKELGLKLVAPAMNYSSGTYADPTKWMDEFVAIVGLDAFDYTAVHSYGGEGVTRQIATDFHNKYGKPVWVTEFCSWPNTGGTPGNVEQQKALMQPLLGWLESTPWIFRYAWFKYDGNQPYCLVQGDYDPVTLTANGYKLNDLGLYYTYLPGYSDDNVLPLGQTVPVSRCNGYYNVNWKTPVAGNTAVEMANMSGKSNIDFLVDAPKAGTYTLTLMAGGYGEPKNFDPKLVVCTVDANGNDKDILVAEKTYSGVLPNNDTDHVALSFVVDLPAGRTTLRIRNTGMALGMTANGIRFAEGIEENPEASIADISADAEAAVEYFTLHGVRVDNPASGSIVIRRCGDKVEKVIVR